MQTIFFGQFGSGPSMNRDANCPFLGISDLALGIPGGNPFELGDMRPKPGGKSLVHDLNWPWSRFFLGLSLTRLMSPQSLSCEGEHCLPIVAQCPTPDATPGTPPSLPPPYPLLLPLCLLLLTATVSIRCYSSSPPLPPPPHPHPPVILLSFSSLSPLLLCLLPPPPP